MSNRRKTSPERPTGPRLSPAQRRRARERLLGWYDAAKRALPWRGEREPYRIWVSEVMLQQTRAGTVAPRYARFLARFPTLTALADAPLEAVLAEWQGLGYYGRARNLHRAARAVAGRRGGELPREREALLKLPGFGPYMAGAVASIAFGERAAALDGNGVRVLARLLDLAAPADAPSGRALLEREAAAIVPPSRPGDFNQALMELGARVCLPRRPRCAECPLGRLCAARARGTVALRPVKSKKAPPRAATLFQFWAERKGRLLLARREEDGLFGGLWELPGWMEEGHKEAPRGPALGRRCRSLLGPGWLPGEELARLVRTLTHRRILFIVLRAHPPLGRRAAPTQEGESATWAGPGELAGLPLSSAQRAAIAAARKRLGDRQGNLFG